MTLAKPLTHRRSSNPNRKRSAAHHNKNGHYIKAYWPYLPIAAIVSVGILLNSWIGTIHRNVLGYATNMSVSGLLDGTNQQRSANGLASLSLNSTLSQAAQAKAADMSANDYWSHNSPSGATPWTFISAAGYAYQTAGENLAYGFTSSSETITGWMNSPGHRANILNSSFSQVGFGTIDIANYQGQGPQTLVVAMYALPVASAAPAAAPAATPTAAPAAAASPAPTAAAAQPAAQTTTAAPSSEETAAEAAPTPSESTQKADTVVAASATKKGDTNTDETSTSTTVPRLQIITSANVAWTQFALSMLISVAVLIFLLRHSFAWHKFLVRGERFVLHHPMLDIGFIALATLGTILLQTSGVIR